MAVDHDGNERLLFHGTSDFEVAKTIATEGFDNRTAKNGGLYGRGTYFAAQTCKSAQYATEEGRSQKASAQMVGTMLLARVAVGHPHYASGPCKVLSRTFIEICSLFGGKLSQARACIELCECTPSFSN